MVAVPNMFGLLCSNPRTVVEIGLIVKTFAIPVSAVDEHDLPIARKNSLQITGLDKDHSEFFGGWINVNIITSIWIAFSLFLDNLLQDIFLRSSASFISFQ